MESLEGQVNADVCLHDMTGPPSQLSYFVPILPECEVRCRNVERETLTKPPPFMNTVKEMRERLTLHCHDCSSISENLTSVKNWRAENKRIYGNKVTLRNYEKVSQLSSRCYDLVLEIEKRFLSGQLCRATRSKIITQHFFRFLMGKTEEEAFGLLNQILEGEKTATEINYIPSGKKFEREEENQSCVDEEQAIKAVEEELVEERKQNRNLEAKYNEIIAKYDELKAEVKRLRDQISKLQGITKMQRDRLEEVVDERMHRDSFVKGVLEDEHQFMNEANQELEEIRRENAVLRMKLECAEETVIQHLDDIEDDSKPAESPSKKDLLEQQRKNNLMHDCATLKKQEFENTKLRPIEGTGLPIMTIYGKEMSKVKYQEVTLDSDANASEVKLEETVVEENDDFCKSKSNDENKKEETKRKRNIVDEVQIGENKIKELNWVAVAYEKQLYIGQVTQVKKYDAFQIKFLERIADRFRWPKKEDCGVVERKFIFSLVDIRPEGKQFNLHGSYENLHKEYKRYQKEYFKSQKRDSGQGETIELPGQNEDILWVASSSSSAKTMTHFLPVDECWQREKCTDHGLPLVQAMPARMEKEMRNTSPPSARTLIKADGNCYFRAISFWMTGSGDHHERVRQIIVSFMENEWHEVRRKIVGENVREYVKNAKMKSLGVWATEKEIFATAELLQTSIYIFVKVGKENRWVPHHPKGGLTLKCIYIANLSHHFEPVTDV